MSASTATLTYFNFPEGKNLSLNHPELFGTVAVSSGTYPANGIPLSFVGHGVYEGKPPYFGAAYSPTTGIPYRFDPVNQTLRIFGYAPTIPGILTTAFTPSANFGTTPPVSFLVNSNQAAFSVNVEAQNSTGANPTLAYVFAQPYSIPPVAVISRGNDAANTAGYFVTEDASSVASGLTFEFVGTPTANDNYVADCIVVDVGTNPSAPVVAGSFALSTGWGTAAALTLENAGSTQNAFSVSIAAGSAATTANPTIVLTFPVPYATPPIFTVSDGVARATTGHWAFLSSTTTTATFMWIGTPTATDTYILDAVSLNQAGPAVTTAAFALSTGFGSTAAISVLGNELAFQLTIAVSGSSIGANPTVTLTLPTALGAIPIWVVSRGDSDTNVGYWAVEDASSTTGKLVVKFVGTPVTAHTYALNAIAQIPANGGTPAELATGGAVPSNVVTDTIYVSGLSSYS